MTGVYIATGSAFILFRVITDIALGLDAGGSSIGSALLVKSAYAAFFAVTEVGAFQLFSDLFSSMPKGDRKEKILTLAAVCGAAGAAFGAWGADPLAGALAPISPGRFESARDNLMVVAGLVLVITPLLAPIKRRGGVEMLVPELPATALKSILGSRKLEGVAVFLALSGATLTIMNYIFYWNVATEAEAGLGFVGFFSNFYLGVNVATFVMLMASGALIGRIGLLAALALLPAILAFGGLAMFLRSGLVVVALLKAAVAAFVEAVFEPAQEFLFVDLEAGHFGGLRPYLENLAPAAGQAAASVAILALSFGLGLDARSMTSLLFFLALLWLGSLAAIARSRGA